jgi:hypothetical protein
VLFVVCVPLFMPRKTAQEAVPVVITNSEGAE